MWWCGGIRNLQPPHCLTFSMLSCLQHHRCFFESSPDDLRPSSCPCTLTLALRLRSSLQLDEVLLEPLDCLPEPRQAHLPKHHLSPLSRARGGRARAAGGSGGSLPPRWRTAAHLSVDRVRGGRLRPCSTISSVRDAHPRRRRCRSAAPTVIQMPNLYRETHGSPQTCKSRCESSPDESRRARASASRTNELVHHVGSGHWYHWFNLRIEY